MSTTSVTTITDKAARLAALNEMMHVMTPCALKETALHVVPGTGNPDADIMFVGEAPGRKEDEGGVPFVGAAGKFLNELLASVNMSRDDIYITNVVKYRPPDNRDPLPEEVAACWPWLKEQIRIIEPKIIIPLGRHALERFVPGRKISEDHGKAFRRAIDDCGTYVFYALYHPAAALYNGSLRSTLQEDFLRLPRLVATIAKEGKMSDEN